MLVSRPYRKRRKRGDSVAFFRFIELENYLSDKLGVKIDLVTEDALKPIIKPYVMETIVYV